jgi:predicted metalloprotease with PDZ domain
MNERRRVDYYDEGALIWMDADVIIRQKTNGRLSLDNFLQRFHGGPSTGPKVVTYDLNEIVATLNAVVPYDWRTFFIDRVYRVRPHAPLDGISNGGWKLVYNSTPNVMGAVDDFRRKTISFMYSIGVIINDKGEVRDINPDLAAAKAGIVPGMTIKKIDGKSFTIAGLHKAVAATERGRSEIKIEAENGSSTESYTVNYQGGEIYPHLVRDMSRADYLSGITKPH